MNYNTLLDLTAELGYRLAKCGAETFRVEESISRILAAYGVSAEVFAIPNCLTVSIETSEGKPMTRMRRIHDASTNMDGVERYNQLSRKICAEVPEPEVAQKWLNEANKEGKSYRLPARIIGNFMTGAGFAILFKGDWLDFVAAGICGILVGLMVTFTGKLQVNQFFSTIAASFIMTFVAYVMAQYGLANHPDAVIIGALMLLVPGLLFTNAMRDIIFGDTNSGVNRIVQVLLIAVAIALGTGAAWSLVSQIWDVPGTSILVDHPYWLQSIAAVIGSFGFCFVFNVHGKGFLLCALGGGLAWGSHCIALTFGAGIVFANFCAAFVSALYSETMARIRKCPAIAYLVVSLIPMFPGAGIYYATSYFLNEDMLNFADKGAETIGIAGAIAVGIVTVSTLVRLRTTWKQRKLTLK